MATLYWGGGTGTWDGFTSTNWYTDLARTTLAGRAPAADDDVIFDATSNATDYTVTIANGTTVCRSCTISGPASGNLTLAGGNNWNIYGNLTLPATGLTRTFTGAIQFWATDSRTITTNGVTLASIIFFAGAGGTWTLQDALNNSTSQIQINAGTFDTNGKNLTCGNISAATGSTAGTLTLGASTVSAVSFSPNAPLVVNAGTSNITLSNSSAGIGGGANYTGNTFYNVTFSSNAVTTSAFWGNNTFNNLTFTTPAAAGISNVVLYGNQTVNGTLTIAGADGAKRYFVQSDTIGTARTLTVATVGTLTDIDFRDITVAGASSPWSGTRLGDCKGNTNITFVAGANKYIAAATGSSNWSANIWATSSGGSAATTNFPLAQDTVIIDNSGLNTSASLVIDKNFFNIPEIDASSRTNAMTISNAAVSVFIYGSFNISSSVTYSPANAIIYAGRNTQNITSNGKTIDGITINSPGGTVKLLDNYVSASVSINLLNGTFDANNKNITCNQIVAGGSGVKTLTLGSGTITSTSGVGQASSVSNLTVTSTTATITCSSSGTIGFNGITATINGNITVNGATSTCNIYGTTTIANLTIADAQNVTGRVPKLVLYGNATITGTLALAGGASVTQRAFVLSDPFGTQRTLSAATVTGLTDIDFRDINATGAANWTTGTRLGDCGGNAGITFPAAKTVYWNLAGTNNWSATAWATSSGGTPAANNFPLAQDTAVFDDTGAVGTVTMDASWNIGTISAGGRTSAWTLAGSGAPFIYGDVTYGSGITTTNTGTYTFSGRGTQTYTTAGKTVTNTFTVDKPAGTFQHGDAYTSSSATNIAITAGTYTTQNYNISAAGFVSSGSNTRSITLGTSTLTLTATGTPFNFTNSTGLTFSGASSTINLSSTSAKTFAGGGQTFGTVSSTGGTTNPLTITGSNKFGTLTNSARTFLVFTAGTTQEATTFTYSGASGSVVRWYTNIPGQRATIKTASSAVGANSTNGGNNSGLTFTGTSPDYFYVKDIAYSSTVISGGNFLMFFN